MFIQYGFTIFCTHKVTVAQRKYISFNIEFKKMTGKKLPYKML